jgi:hypothetical protein
MRQPRRAPEASRAGHDFRIIAAPGAIARLLFAELGGPKAGLSRAQIGPGETARLRERSLAATLLAWEERGSVAQRTESRGQPYFPMMKNGNPPEGVGHAGQPPGQ